MASQPDKVHRVFEIYCTESVNTLQQSFRRMFHNLFLSANSIRFLVLIRTFIAISTVALLVSITKSNAKSPACYKHFLMLSF
jgi:hypothetical protein